MSSQGYLAMEDVWTMIQKRLDGNPFGAVQILADGYRVDFRTCISKNRLVILVWVNGEMKGEWLIAKDGRALHEEGRKFFCPKSVRTYPKIQEKKLARVFGKERAAELTKPHIVVFDARWFSAKKLVAHLKKTCQNVEWVENVVYDW